MNQLMDIHLEEMEEMAAPVDWFWYGVGAVAGFGFGVGVGVLIAT